jgi:hypothetical protein
MNSSSTMNSTYKISPTKVSQCLMVVLGVMMFAMNMFSETVTVQAIDDIYAAGHSTVPNTLYPGTFPTSTSFTAGPNQILTFSSVTGTVGCNFVITNGPDGTCFPAFGTTVTSYGGISGISVNGLNMFLVGVFLSAAEPSGAGPPVLSYNYGTPGGLNTTDPGFAPGLDQVFFIGDGLTGTGAGLEQIFHVPGNASRLSLGFADSFDSVPSYYADDVGSLTASFTITSSPEPKIDFLITAGVLLGVAFCRRKFRTKMN